MNCGGPGFTATRPEVNRWRETGSADMASRWHWRSLSLTIQWGFSLVGALTKWEQMIGITFTSSIIPSQWTGGFTVVSGNGSVGKPRQRAVFARHHTRFRLSGTVCRSDSLTGSEGPRFHPMWLTIRDRANEAILQRRLTRWLIVFGGRQFLAPEVVPQLSFI